MLTRNYGLDIIRSVAILLVVFIHVLFNLYLFNKTGGYYWYLAYLGVDLFFALSGFLIGSIIINAVKINSDFSFKSVKKFLIRRALRTMPLYFIFLIINWIVSIYILRSYNIFDWKFLFWLQSFAWQPPSFYGESWSLCIEEWFYLSFSVLLSIFLKFKWFGSKQGLLIFPIVFILIITVIRILPNYQSLQLFNVTIFRLDAIAYGVLLSVINIYYGNLLRGGRLYYLFTSGTILTLIGVFLFLSHNKYGSVALLYYNFTGIGLAIIVYCFYHFFATIKPIKNDIFTITSKISYSMYLSNLVVIYIAKSFFPQYAHLLLFSFAVLLLIFLVSIISYNFIEKPILKFRDQNIQMSKN